MNIQSEISANLGGLMFLAGFLLVLAVGAFLADYVLPRSRVLTRLINRLPAMRRYNLEHMPIQVRGDYRALEPVSCLPAGSTIHVQKLSDDGALARIWGSGADGTYLSADIPVADLRRKCELVATASGMDGKDYVRRYLDRLEGRL